MTSKLVVLTVIAGLFLVALAIYAVSTSNKNSVKMPYKPTNSGTSVEAVLAKLTKNSPTEIIAVNNTPTKPVDNYVEIIDVKVKPIVTLTHSSTPYANNTSRDDNTYSTGSLNNAKIYHKKYVNKSGRNDIYPPKPASEPDSEYAALMTPTVLNSVYNAEAKPEYKLAEDGNVIYTSKHACNTPSDQLCVGNDTCAQFGVGESCQGPEGATYCVCESSLKDGVVLENGKRPTDSEVVIGVGAVCTDNNQCCTGYCAPAMLGQFSKFCDCPDGTQWNPSIKQCVKPVKDSIYTPVLKPSGSCPYGGQGKQCELNLDCPKGMACNADRYCTCMLSTPADPVENRIKMGGNCDVSTDCLGSLQCREDGYGSNVCLCPQGLFYDSLTDSCNCPDPNKYYDQETKTCYTRDNFPRKICPNGNTIHTCLSDFDVGLGEYCDPTQKVAVCTAVDLGFSNDISGGGRCSSNDQCVSGKCVQENNGLTYCTYY